MARLNLEDRFFREVVDLAITLGSKDLAYGMAVRFFREAQDRYKEGRGFTEEEFKELGFSEALFPKFARRVSGGIVAAGAEKHFAWLEQKREAGRKGGKSRSPEKIRHLKQNQDETEAQPKHNRSETKQTVTSYSYSSSPSFSLSSSDSSSHSNSNTLRGGSATRSARAPSQTGPTWDAYSKAYHQRHGVEPTRNARVNGMLSQFVKRVPLEDAPEIAKFYVRHNRSFYVQKSHPVSLLLQDAESLRTEWLNGRAVLTTDGRDVERKQGIFNAFAKHIDPEVSNGN